MKKNRTLRQRRNFWYWVFAIPMMIIVNIVLYDVSPESFGETLGFYMVAFSLILSFSSLIAILVTIFVKDKYKDEVQFMYEHQVIPAHKDAHLPVKKHISYHWELESIHAPELYRKIVLILESMDLVNDIHVWYDSKRAITVSYQGWNVDIKTLTSLTTAITETKKDLEESYENA